MEGMQYLKQVVVYKWLFNALNSHDFDNLWTLSRVPYLVHESRTQYQRRAALATLTWKLVLHRALAFLTCYEQCVTICQSGIKKLRNKILSREREIFLLFSLRYWWGTKQNSEKTNQKKHFLLSSSRLRSNISLSAILFFWRLQ